MQRPNTTDTTEQAPGSSWAGPSATRVSLSTPQPKPPCLQPFLNLFPLCSLLSASIHSHIKAAPASLLVLNFSTHFKPELTRGIKGPLSLSPGALPCLAGCTQQLSAAADAGDQERRAKPEHCCSAAPCLPALIAQETLLSLWNWLVMGPRLTLSLDPVCL